MAKQTKTAKPIIKTDFDAKNIQKTQTLLIIVLGIILYGWTLTFDYALDDTLMITGNKFTQQGFKGIPDIFSSDAFEGFFGSKGQLQADDIVLSLILFLRWKQNYLALIRLLDIYST